MRTPNVTNIVDTFFTKYQPRAYNKGDILIRAGDEPKGIYYLKSGHVRQYVITKDGEEMILNIYKPGAFFPMAWAVNAFPNTYYFEAMDDTQILVAPKDDVLSFVKKEPDVLFDLLRRLYIGLDGVLSRLEHLMSGKARARLLIILVISAKRFGGEKQGGIKIGLKLTHQNLASLSGLTRETVSREMIEMKKQGFLDYTNTVITIHDVTTLENELD